MVQLVTGSVKTLSYGCKARHFQAISLKLPFTGIINLTRPAVRTQSFSSKGSWRCFTRQLTPVIYTLKCFHRATHRSAWPLNGSRAPAEVRRRFPSLPLRGETHARLRTPADRTHGSSPCAAAPTGTATAPNEPPAPPTTSPTMATLPPPAASQPASPPEGKGGENRLPIGRPSSHPSLPLEEGAQ